MGLDIDGVEVIKTGISMHSSMLSALCRDSAHNAALGGQKRLRRLGGQNMKQSWLTTVNQLPAIPQSGREGKRTDSKSSEKWDIKTDLPFTNNSSLFLRSCTPAPCSHLLSTMVTQLCSSTWKSMVNPWISSPLNYL